MRLATASQMRECDRTTIEELGLPGIALMESAGQGAARALIETLTARDLTPGRADVGVFCGGGNNGGDGFVIARALLAHGYEVRVYLLSPRGRVQGDAAVNLALLERIIAEDLGAGRGLLRDWGEELEAGEARIGELLGVLPAHSVFIDAMLGTGLSSAPRSPYAEVIAHLNAASALRFAVDVPTGLCADTGQVLGDEAFEADQTVTFALPKVGLWVYPGRAVAGEVTTIDIGIPPGVYDKVGLKSWLLTCQRVGMLLPDRERTGHKGTFGHVLALGGDQGKVGALALTSVSALRGGAGLVTAGGARGAVEQLTLTHPEIMTAAALDEGPGAWAALIENKDVIAIGPGLGTSERAAALLLWLLAEAERPLVLDADALNIVAMGNTPALIEAAHRVPVVLTPHPGELGRLLGSSSREVVNHPLQSAQQFAAETGCVVVSKMASTVIAHPEGHTAVNSSGNPGMGTAGSGDVLTGLVASLIGQGLDPWEAAQAAVFVHGLSGDLAGAALGERSLIASDLIRFYPEAFRACS
ncbi:MAG: bifunctional ADP-dependent NAD(P)H-hydrate dehydratase/NAD(P)H-hydrate epimerase [Myxococcales bacterium]|nr:bifunctional ADP-dependent NAD(P)H-hydrate dehydratase/NAD(P)H-hydrate epimerase [Myxococcales bacterium]